MLFIIFFFFFVLEFLFSSRDHHVSAILEFCLAPFSVCIVINYRTTDTYFIEIMTALPKI